MLKRPSTLSIEFGFDKEAEGDDISLGSDIEFM
jgi:hypothetical protein